MRIQRAIIAVALCLLGCAHQARGSGPPRGRVVVASPEATAPGWSPEEEREPAALRNLRRTDAASFHLLRLAGARDAQLHERSDLVFMTLAGRLEVKLGERTLEVQAGDVIEVPRGTPYALRNLDDGASSAYLVFTPALAPDDKKPAGDSGPRTDVWQWNLWPQ